MTYYKVCSTDDDGSMWSSYAIGECRLRYGVGRRTRPVSGTGLLAFATLAEARRYHNDSGCRILAGTGEPGPPLREMARPRPTEADWARLMWARGPQIGFDWPHGTVSLAWFEGEEVVE